MAKPRYLTKSRFKLATECSAKLFYTGKQNLYPNTKMEDFFLAALAEGGYQVGGLAKFHFPGGTVIMPTDHEAALAQTGKRLAQQDDVIYKVAVRHGSPMRRRRAVMVPKGRTGVTQALPSVESATRGLSTWDVN